MQEKIYFQGDIFLKEKRESSEKKPIKFRYDLTKEVKSEKSGVHNLENILMTNFNTINFTQEEKKDLSVKMRKLIYQYQNLDWKIIKDYSTELLKVLNAMSSRRVIVEASHLGAMICLSTLFSGKLGHQKRVQFHLDSTPLGLFPKNLNYKNKIPSSYKVTLYYEEDAWPYIFPTVCRCPEYLHFDYKINLSASQEKKKLPMAS